MEKNFVKSRQCLIEGFHLSIVGSQASQSEEELTQEIAGNRWRPKEVCEIQAMFNSRFSFEYRVQPSKLITLTKKGGYRYISKII